MKKQTTWIWLSVGVASVMLISYWQRQRITRLSKKAFTAFGNIFSNPEKLGSPDAKGSIANMKPELANRLGEVKKIWERKGHKGKLRANSGFRTDEHNKKVGGKESSEHKTGEGVDIAMSNKKQAIQFAFAASRAGFKRIGIGNNFVHLGTSKTLPQTSWTYPGTGINMGKMKNQLNEVYSQS